MTNQQHPITPPPELVRQWTDEIYGGPGVVAASDDVCLAKLAAQWGADQELEACCAWFVRDWTDVETADKLRAARRPKPQSLKKQSLALVDLIQGNKKPWDIKDLDVVRRALEALPDD